MHETSREGFIPKHLRGGRRVGPDTCQWGRIADQAAQPFQHKDCAQPIDISSGVYLCRDHIRRIGYIGGLMSQKRAKEWLWRNLQLDLEDERRENKRLRDVIRWQAKKLRGEETQDSTETSAPQQGTVYFLRVGGYIKIGWTSDLNKRMRNGYHPDSQLLAVKPGTRADERAIHRKHAHLITHGREWFPMAPQILEEIEAAKREHGEPPAVLFSASAHKARALGTAPDTRAGDYPIGKSTG